MRRMALTKGVLIGLIIFFAASACTSWERSNEIIGETPIEKTQSLVSFINDNPEYRGIGKVFIADIDYKSSAWYYTFMVFSSWTQIREDQGIQLKYFKIIRDIFGRTADFDSAKKILVLVILNDGSGFFLTADGENLEKIKKYPQEALRYVFQKEAGMMPLANEPQEGSVK